MARLFVKASLIVLFVVSLQYVINIGFILGIHRHLFNHTPGPCRIVPGVEVGSEDITTTSKGIAFITTGLKASPADWENTALKSRIFTFDFNYPERNVSEVNILAGSHDIDNANYLGMSIWEDKETGKVTLFVANRIRKPSVERFEYIQSSNTLQHEVTIDSQDLNIIYSPNDVVAVSDRRFYVSNDVRYGSLFEFLLPMRTGTVAYYDGEKARIVATGFTMANGINRSPDGRNLYVSGLFDEEINVFNITKDGSLTLLKKIHAHSAVDNIEVDPATGDLWLGCHFQLYKLVLGDKDDRHKGPSQVLKMTLDKDLNAEVREVLADDGQLLKGSSVASVFGDRMLVGTIKNKMLYCGLQAY